MWVELITISALILLNGFFACAELAIVNTRRSRIKQLVKEKNVSARLVQGFQEDSERFLATTQIGITVAGASAAAMGDRKSTRLNSSHGYISYAVFCLKKKKKIKIVKRLIVAIRHEKTRKDKESI